MLSVEIKINQTTLKKFTAVRLDLFKGCGGTHEYEVEMIVDNHMAISDRYPVGKIEHRYCAGAVSLVEKMLKLVKKKGMHR